MGPDSDPSPFIPNFPIQLPLKEPREVSEELKGVPFAERSEQTQKVWWLFAIPTSGLQEPAGDTCFAQDPAAARR